MEIEESDWDRTFFKFSANMQDTSSAISGLLGQRPVTPLTCECDEEVCKIQEIASQLLHFLGAALAFCLAGTHLLLTAVFCRGTSQLCRVAGARFQENGYTYISGQAPEKSVVDGQASVMTWNLESLKIGQVTSSIQSEDPDIVVLQGVDFGLVEPLVAALQDQYPHFYTHLGAQTSAEETGCMVITKYSAYSFTHTDFWHKDSKPRGFAVLEIRARPEDPLPCARIVGTELSAGKAGQTRIDQFAEIVDTLVKPSVPIPTFLVGNLSVDRDDETERAHFSRYLHHGYREGHPTCDTEGVAAFISLFKREPTGDGRTFWVHERNIRLIECHMVKEDDSIGPHAVVMTFKGLKEGYLGRLQSSSSSTGIQLPVDEASSESEPDLSTTQQPLGISEVVCNAV